MVKPGNSRLAVGEWEMRKHLYLLVSGGKNPWCMGFPACMFDNIIVRRRSTGKDCDSDCIPKPFHTEDAEV